MKKDQYILVLDNKHKGNYENQTIRYKIVPADELKPEELKIYKKIQWSVNNRNGTVTKRIDSWDRSVCFIRGTKEQVKDSFMGITKGDTDTRYIPFVPMKKKTREHFGGIVENIMKTRIEDMFAVGEMHVLIMKTYYSESGNNRGVRDNTIKYQIKSIDELTPEESDVLNSNRTVESHAYIHGYEAHYALGADEVEFIFDTKEELEEEIKELKRLTKNIYPIVPMKKKTREHFGDIMESRKVLGNDYVLIVRNDYKKLWTKKGHKRRVTIKPVNDMTHEELEAFKSRKTTRVPGYDNGYEAFGVMGIDEIEFIFDSKEELEKLVKEWISWGCDIEEHIPMKPETRRYFGGIVEKASFMTVVSSLLEKYELDEKIIAPAIKIGNKVVKGQRGQMHIDVLERIGNRIATLHNVSLDKAFEIMGRMRQNGRIIEGFIDINGRFSTREKAYDIMKYFKSIKNDPILDRGPSNNKFYSEDLM